MDEEKTRTRRYRKGKITYDMSPLPPKILSVDPTLMRRTRRLSKMRTRRMRTRMKRRMTMRRTRRRYIEGNI